MARKKNYRFKKNLNISREDALYLNKLTPDHLRYVLGRIIQEVPKEDTPKKKRVNKKKSKRAELIEPELLRLKLDHPKRTDNILRKAAATKVSQIVSKNKHEELFKGILESMCIIYEYQKVFMNNITYSVVDFYLPEYNVVCEIDGKIHDTENGNVRDMERTRILKTQNEVKDVFRFYNDDVEHNQSTVCESLDVLLSNL